MRRLSFIGLALVLASTHALPAAAQALVCRNDERGRTICRTTDGRTVVGHFDAVGQARYGSALIGFATPGHPVLFRDSSGALVEGQFDRFGVATFQDSSGETVRVRVDRLGAVTYTYGDGRTVRCRTDALKRTRCY